MMRKKFKKILLAIVIATLCIVGESGISVFASDVEHYDDIATECDINLPENSDDTHEYWEFTGSNMRMGSDGSFTFSYQRSMQSDDFKPASSSITVYATATSSSSDQTYYIALYKKNASGNDTQIKDIKYTANGKTQSYTFKELSTDSTYYLYFTKPLTSTAKITGSGRIETIQ